RSGVMESLACCNEMKAGNAQRNNQLNKYDLFNFSINKKLRLSWKKGIVNSILQIQVFTYLLQK
ncbi:MAG: hypothetical protein JXR70_17170, partial [Spirochaetales bacterium]|nr:hypothetical protein [Spirochaetales bacterium]